MCVSPTSIGILNKTKEKSAWINTTLLSLDVIFINHLSFSCLHHLMLLIDERQKNDSVLLLTQQNTLEVDT